MAEPFLEGAREGVKRVLEGGTGCVCHSVRCVLAPGRNPRPQEDPLSLPRCPPCLSPGPGICLQEGGGWGVGTCDQTELIDPRPMKGGLALSAPCPRDPLDGGRLAQLRGHESSGAKELGGGTLRPEPRGPKPAAPPPAYLCSRQHQRREPERLLHLPALRP